MIVPMYIAHTFTYILEVQTILQKNRVQGPYIRNSHGG
jgi:hypothetical protein